MFHCAQVAVNDAAPVFDQLFTYRIPDAFTEYAVTGARVSVPFGRANTVRTGIIMAVSDEEDPDGRLKYLTDVEKDDHPVSEDLVDLISFLKEKTFCTYSDALKAVLPKNIRAVTHGGKLTLSSFSHKVKILTVNEDAVGKVTKRQREILDALSGHEYTAQELIDVSGATRETLKRMTDAGLIRETEEIRNQDLFVSARDSTAEDAVLSEAQSKALEEIKDYYTSKGGRGTVLLHGVTSSGKTQIYIKLMKEELERGRSVIFLVPEITLSNQTIMRLREVFGSKVAIINSALSATERTIEWSKLRSGQCSTAVGTRSAIFAPLENIGLIIIDEEQENSYNSEQSPKYSTIEVAQRRASRHGAKLLLASATPLIEHYHWGKMGRIGLVSLKERYNSMPLPDVDIVDMRDELTMGNSTCISNKLASSIRSRLEKKEQTLLLLNRRGYNTVSICTKCRQVLKCPNCDTPLVHHKREGRLICHYCGHSEPAETKCRECGGELRQQGFGTEKIEETIGLLFPEASVARLDLDIAQKKHSSEKILMDFADRKYDILIGTQMIAKGLDFANVTLVGVISADQMLLLPNYDSIERAFSTLTQVVGRGGRGEKAGEAIIQTFDPKNPLIRLAALQNYEAFYEAEIIQRRDHEYPPFCKMCTVSITGEDEKAVIGGSHQYISIVMEIAKSMEKPEPIRILGPVPMRIAYINAAFRYKVTVKGRYGQAFRDIINISVKKFRGIREFKDLRISTDFNINDS